MVEKHVDKPPNLVPESSLSDTRNGFARKAFHKPADFIAERIHRMFPKLTANEISAFGLALTATFSYLAGKIPPLATAAGLAVAEGFDWVAGPVARLRAKLYPNEIYLADGKEVDPAADRGDELAKGLSRMFAAAERDDMWGLTAAALATFSNPIPSILRAEAEKERTIVSENGRNIFELLGTRGGRAVMGIVATAFPEITIKGKKIPLQTILDTATFVSNVVVAYDRYNKLTTGEKTLDDNKAEEAKRRSTLLKVIAAGTGVVVLHTYNLLTQENSYSVGTSA